MKHIHPRKWIRIIWKYYLMPEKVYLKWQFKKRYNEKLNLKKPVTFSEKINWLKLYDRNPKYHKLVDKYEVKKIIAQEIGEHLIIPTYGVWDKFDDINFDALPEKFVLKCTHDSASVVICTDKKNFDFKKARKKLSEALKVDYYHFQNLQWAYKGIKPRIMAEKFLEDKAANELSDYKFYCFNGVAKLCQVIANRFSKVTIDFYDPNWNYVEGLVGLSLKAKNSNINVQKPEKYEEMIAIAEKLSQSIPFVRVDMYYVDNQIYFGEMTFYPAGGMGYFRPDKWNSIIGDWIVLPQKKLR